MWYIFSPLSMVLGVIDFQRFYGLEDFFDGGWSETKKQFRCSFDFDIIW